MQTDVIARRFRAVPHDRYAAMVRLVRFVVERQQNGGFCEACYMRGWAHSPDCPVPVARAVLAEIEEDGE